MRMKGEIANMSEWREAEFAQNCTYIVNDQPCDQLKSDSSPRAMTSIPRNLRFKYNQASEVSLLFYHSAGMASFDPGELQGLLVFIPDEQ
ncbi:PRDM1 protein, partial [Polyodon spathula]|nr:PRDM1 protein [Polyodon spathula]